MNRNISILLSVLFTSLFFHQAFAFEGFEHEQLGDMSLLIASNYFRAENLNHALNDAESRKADEFERVVGEYIAGLPQTEKGSSAPSIVTYGHIVKLVDYMKAPYEMLHTDDTGSYWPHDVTNCNLSYLIALHKDWQATAIASHEDPDHFGGRALFAFWFWHQSALEIAKENNLFGALMVNAYADHFLQDSLAPGHIIALRDEAAHDLPALGWHDYYNRVGMTYFLTNAGVLLPVLNETVQLSKSRGDVLENSFYGKDGNKGESLAITTGQLERLIDQCKTGSYREEFHGDASLPKYTNQFAFMSVYLAQSSSDVLNTWWSGTITNAFKTYQWKSVLGFYGPLLSITPKPLHRLILIQQAFGGLSCDYGDHHEYITTKVLMPHRLGIKDVSESATNYSINASIARDLGKNPILGTYLGMQSIANSDGSRLRGLFGVEALVLGARPDLNRAIVPDLKLPQWLPDQWGLTLGYSGIADVHEQGHGPSARIVFPLTRVNLQWSILGGARYYSGSGVSGWGDFEEVRLDWGMHVGNLFFGIGHDHFADNGNLKNGLTFQAGISMALPESRIWPIKYLWNPKK